jgi:hypothetical protein
MNLAKITTAVVLAGLLAGGGGAYLARSASPGRPAPASPATMARPPGGPATATLTASERFNNWIDGSGGTLLENAFGILSQTKSDAAARNLAGLKADASALVAYGKAALADPSPSHGATWDSAFSAMVRAGQDLAAGNLAGAVTESNIVAAKIYAFNSQTS